MMNGKSFMYGIIVGGVIGSITTLLTTPSSGKKIRDNLTVAQQNAKESYQDIAGEGKVLANDFKKAITESSNVITSVATDLKKSVQHWQNDAAHHRKNIEDKMENIQKELEELEKTVKQNNL
ncbi:YtxH domain-containing protein [Sutcliffiella cohnii]|nr:MULTISPECIES: YtxH domain-containing protein [Sutcliffiella]WBL16141.1 YtxH domain-containing protein [Sutcliffiella sp. NC1]